MNGGDWYKAGRAFHTNAERLTAAYISPAFSDLCWKVGAAFWFTVFISGFILWRESRGDKVIGYTVLGLFAFWLIGRYTGLFLNTSRILFGPRLDVVVAPSWVKVGGHFFYKTYRSAQYGFAVEDHPKAMHEEEERRLDPQRNAKKPSVYRFTKQLVLYVEDRRIVLANIFNAPSTAQSMAMKLNMMKQTVNARDMTGDAS